MKIVIYLFVFFLFFNTAHAKEFRIDFTNEGMNMLKKNSLVTGALFEISKTDEKKLDIYEDYPVLYRKHYFKYYGKKVMTYLMVKKTRFTYPTEKYLNVVKRGYKDCKLEKKYLLKALMPSW